MCSGWRIAVSLSLLLFGQPGWAQTVYLESATAWNLDSVSSDGYFGDGVSFYDFDQDGWDDLTIGTDDGEALQFYRNTGTGSFERLLPPPVMHTGDVKQVLWVDYDNDGDPDLYVNDYNTTDRLYRNDGSLNMTDVTASCGLPMTSVNSFGADFADYDRDGWLDLYVNYRALLHPDGRNRLFRNLGGVFVEVTDYAGIEDSSKLTFCTAFFDYNHDGWPDLYEANDKLDLNTLLLNNGSGGFNNTSLVSGSGIQIEAMSTTIGDYDMDGDQDIYVTNTPGGNALLSNNGDGTFTELADAAGVAMYSIGWAANFTDVDNDLDLDLYVSGMVYGTFLPSSVLYENQGDMTFTVPTGIGMESDTTQTLVHAIGDVNNDGFPDIGSANSSPEVFDLWVNQATSGNHWLKLHLEGTVSNRDAIGCWVEGWTNGNRLIRYTHHAQGYLGQNSRYLMFGLGAAEQMDSLIIEWPSGRVDRFYDLCVDRMLKVVEGETQAVLPMAGQTEWSFCSGEVLELEAGEYLSYLWSSGETSSSIEIDLAGQYWLWAEREDGFCGTMVFDVEELPAPELTGFATTPDDLTGSGTATVGVSGGTPPYTYFWNDLMEQNGQTAIGLWTGNYQVTVTDAMGCSVVGDVMVDVSTGILETEASLELYPIPASDHLNIRFEPQHAEVELRLHNALGQTIQRQVLPAGSDQARFELLDLEPGQYWLEFTSGNLLLNRSITVNSAK